MKLTKRQLRLVAEVVSQAYLSILDDPAGRTKGDAREMEELILKLQQVEGRPANLSHGTPFEIECYLEWMGNQTLRTKKNHGVPITT